MLQTMQQTGGAIGVAALTSIAIAHGRSDALLTGAGIIIVALLVAYFAIRPTQNVASNAEETAGEMASLAMVD
jgi:hypothetical protein